MGKEREDTSAAPRGPLLPAGHRSTQVGILQAGARAMKRWACGNPQQHRHDGGPEGWTRCPLGAPCAGTERERKAIPRRGVARLQGSRRRARHAAVCSYRQTTPGIDRKTENAAFLRRDLLTSFEQHVVAGKRKPRPPASRQSRRWRTELPGQAPLTDAAHSVPLGGRCGHRVAAGS